MARIAARLAVARARSLGLAFTLFAIAVGAAQGCGPRRPPLAACAPPPGPSASPEQARRAADAGLEHVRCDQDQYQYGLRGAGPRDATIKEISDWNTRAAHDLMALEGVTMVGFGGCCPAGGRPFHPEGCLVVYVDQGTPADEQLAARLAQSAARWLPESARARVAISMGPPRVPRCRPTDPGCGPLPYGSHGICFDAGLAASSPRRPVDGGEGGPPPPRDACGHDGECQACNTACVGYRAGSISCTEELSLTLRDAACGCVGGRCGWFEFD
jgi:hypothetical protein